MEKLLDLKRIVDNKLIAVVRTSSEDSAIGLIEAICQGGIDIIEVTMTTPGALRVIEKVTKVFPKEQVLVGAGTVLDQETARACLLAGAEFIVSPHLDKGIITMCHRYQKVVMQGAMSLNEVIEAMESSVDIVKLFPGNMFSPSIIKTLKGPLPQAPLMPTGGVNIENITEWLEAGAVAVGVGGELTKEAEKQRDFKIATEISQAFVQKVINYLKKT